MRANEIKRLHSSVVALIRVYQFRNREAACCYDISVAQSHALDRLRELGALTMNELAGSLYLEKSTMSRIVDGLEEKGHVRRDRHPDDGRAIRLSLTPRGARLAETIEQDMIEKEKVVFAEFNVNELKTIARGIERLAAASSDRVEVAGGACRWSE